MHCKYNHGHKLIHWNISKHAECIQRGYTNTKKHTVHGMQRETIYSAFRSEENSI